MNLEEIRLPTSGLDSDAKKAEEALLAVGRAGAKAKEDLVGTGEGADKASGFVPPKV